MKDKIITSSSDMSCPLCLSNNHNAIFLRNFKRAIDYHFYNSISESRPHFFKCLKCSGIFRSPEHILPELEEHNRYSVHENSLLDIGYLKYLNESLHPFLQLMNPTDRGLDFGCGPTKGIEFLLQQKSYNIQSFDKYFYPKIDDKFSPYALTHQKLYDYIICHEVIEHFVNVKGEFELLLSLLTSNGKLFIRTELQEEDFENWYYKNDSTHVFFFSLKTFEYIAETYDLDFLAIEKNKFVFSVKRLTE